MCIRDRCTTYKKKLLLCSDSDCCCHLHLKMLKTTNTATVSLWLTASGSRITFISQLDTRLRAMPALRLYGTLRSVSYTHLDVYKRQGSAQSTKNREVLVMSLALPITMLLLSTKLLPLMSESISNKWMSERENCLWFH